MRAKVSCWRACARLVATEGLDRIGQPTLARVNGPKWAFAFQAALGIVVFVIAYRRNRKYFHRSVPGAVGVAFAAAALCPIGALLFYAISDPRFG